MTDNRAFKKLVRDYMEEHGVSYNRALKDVRLPLSAPSLASQIPFEAFKVMQEKRGGMILISGLSGSGKTTIMGDLQQFFIEREDRVINISPYSTVLEEKLRVDNQSPGHFFAFYPGVHEESIEWYIRHSLRMRPDTITFDEIRDDKAADGIIRAALVGSLTIPSIHASTPSDAVERLHNFAEFDRTGHLHHALSLIIHATREGDRFSADVYKYDAELEEIYKSGNMELFEEELQKRKF